MSSNTPNLYTVMLSVIYSLDLMEGLVKKHKK